jgi:dienelactone hydrolase
VFLSCEFEKSKFVVRVVFDAKQRVAGLFFQPDTPSVPYRTPAYAQPDAFEEHAITLNDDPWKVPGTLTVPKGDGPFPAVVLVAGSGPNDRDETIGPNKPLKDLAWGLASQGIVVLRYDKRTRIHGARMVASKLPLTVREEALDDTLQAVRLLRATASVDPRRIFVVGHSLGGYLVPRIAKTDGENWIRGYVILAGNTRPLEDLMWEQVNYLLRLDGTLSDEDQQQLDQLEQQIKIVTDPALADKRSTTPAILGAGPDYWLDLRNYDPVAMAVAMKQPLLILHADRDYQVTEKDLAGWQAVAESREGVTLRRYARLNHLFQPGEGRSMPSEYLAPNHFDPLAIEDIVKWIESQKP